MFSFHPVKHITTGEGGIITTNSKELYDKMRILRTHGITNDPAKFRENSHDPWHQEMQVLGYNYRLTDIQCALGVSQLKKADDFVKKRRLLAERYIKAFADVPGIETLKEPNGSWNSYHLFVIKVKDAKTRLQLFNHLAKDGVMCQVHYIPVYLHPYYQGLGFKKGLCPNAERFYQQIISLPLYPELSANNQERVIKNIIEFLNKAH